MKAVFDFLGSLVVVLGQIFGLTALAIFRFFVPSKKSLKDEIILVTGAGSGIGRLQALRYSKLGAILVLWDIDGPSVKKVAAEIEESGGKAAWYVCDVSKREEIYKVAAQVKAKVGDVTILVNNAGVVTGKKFMDSADEKIIKTFEINTLSHFWTTKAFLPSMLENNHGHIVTISSSAGRVGVCGLADYCASKFAVLGFDESLRFEFEKLGKTGVHTTCVCPFFINTGMFHGVTTRYPFLMPILEPEYVADKIVNAVQTNQSLLVLPRFAYLMPVFRALPTSALDTAARMLGVSESMETFKGRN